VQMPRCRDGRSRTEQMIDGNYYRTPHNWRLWQRISLSYSAMRSRIYVVPQVFRHVFRRFLCGSHFCCCLCHKTNAGSVRLAVLSNVLVLRAFCCIQDANMCVVFTDLVLVIDLNHTNCMSLTLLYRLTAET